MNTDPTKVILSRELWEKVKKNLAFTESGFGYPQHEITKEIEKENPWLIEERLHKEAEYNKLVENNKKIQANWLNKHSIPGRGYRDVYAVFKTTNTYCQAKIIGPGLVDSASINIKVKLQYHEEAGDLSLNFLTEELPNNCKLVWPPAIYKAINTIKENYINHVIDNTLKAGILSIIDTAIQREDALGNLSAQYVNVIIADLSKELTEYDKIQAKRFGFPEGFTMHITDDRYNRVPLEIICSNK